MLRPPHRLRFTWVAAALVAGCNDVVVETATGSGSSSATETTSTSATTSSTSSSSSASGTGGGPPGPSILFSGTLVPNGPGAPIAGVTVCPVAALGFSCTQSDGKGQFEISLPANAETGIFTAKLDLGSILIPIPTTDADMSGAVLGVPKEAQMAAYYEAAGTPYPNTGHGYLAVFVQPANDFQSGQEGATVSITPAVGVGPLYADVQGAPDPTLTATSALGVARFGAIPLGEVEVAVTCPAGLVAQPVFFGWPGADLSKLRGPIQDALETRIGFGCF